MAGRTWALRLALGACLYALSAGVQAQSQLAPQPTVLRTVNDEVGVLSQRDGMQLARRLVEISERTGVRIVMVIVDTVGTEPIDDYADRLAPRWARERAADPDRMIIVVIATEDRYLVARPGRDLRLGTLVNPAELSQSVGRFFGQGRWYDGLVALTDKLLEVIEKNPPPPKAQKESRP